VDQLCRRVDTELFAEALPVVIDGLEMNAQLAGDAFAGQSLGNQSQDFKLPASQCGCWFVVMPRKATPAY
jgi:hypothetical protein